MDEVVDDEGDDNDVDSEDEGVHLPGRFLQWNLRGKPSQGNDSGKGSTSKVSKGNASTGVVSKRKVSGKGFYFGKAPTGKSYGKGSTGKGKQKITTCYGDELR
jgi:hypothetical protein